MYFGALEWFKNENTELLGKKGQVISGKGTGENIKRDVVNLKKLRPVSQFIQNISKIPR